MTLREAKDLAVREYLRELVTRHDWNLSAASRESGIDYAWLCKTLLRLGIKRQKPTQVGGSVPSTLRAIREEAAKQYIRDLLERNRWNVLRSAIEAGQSRTNFQRTLKVYGFTRPDPIRELIGGADHVNRI